MNKWKVLLADDEVTIIEGFKRLFDWEKHGYAIVGEANDGVCAVNMAETHRPDIVIMDINMPLLSGLDAIRTIRQGRPDTAFIIVSGYDDFAYVREALQLEVVDYLLKPVRFEELSDVLDRLRLKLVRQRNCGPGPGDPPGGKLVYRIIAYLSEHLEEDLSLKSLSEQFHLNASYLSQLFKQETGMNYRPYLTQLRINRAKELLLTTDLSVSRVAAMVGFNDYRVFTRVFKKQENTLPSKYRHSHH